MEIEARPRPRQSPRGRGKADGDWGLKNRNTMKTKSRLYYAQSDTTFTTLDDIMELQQRYYINVNASSFSFCNVHLV